MLTRQYFVYLMGGVSRQFLLMPDEAAMFQHMIREGTRTVQACFECVAGYREGSSDIRLVIEYLDKPSEV